MKLYNSSTEIKKPPKHAIVAIGNFDGVHLGHKNIIKKMIAHKKKIKGTTIVYTFHPHPSHILDPHHPSAQINSLEERLALLKNMGIDMTISENFNKEFSEKSARDFFDENILKHLNPVALYVGYNFNFGKGREGNVSLLKKWCKASHINLHITSPFKIKQEIVSSSKIRKLILDGSVKKASQFLGRPYFIQGKVVSGEKRGQTIGVPTANVETHAQLMPKNGIYVTRVEHEGTLYPGATSVGNAPTFSEDSPFTIETHILDFDESLYGKHLIIHFIEWIREIKKFPSIYALQQAIQADIALTRRILSHDLKDRFLEVPLTKRGT